MWKPHGGVSEYQSPCLLSGTAFSPKFWNIGGGGGGLSEKNGWLGELKEFLIFAWGAYYVACQKRLCRIRYVSEGSVSNVNLGPLSVVVKDKEHIGINGAFFLPQGGGWWELFKFFSASRFRKKSAGLWFARGSQHPGWCYEREWIMHELWWGDWPCIFTKMRNSWYKTIIFCYWWWFLTKAAINNFLLDFAFAIFWFYILQLWPFWTAALPEVTYEFVFVHSSICPLVSSQCKISEMVHQCFLMLSKALESHKVKNVAKLDFWKKVPMTQNWGFGEFDKNRIHS